jgi:two-component system, NtrC family, nitrogen regulation response regulator NtrX
MNDKKTDVLIIDDEADIRTLIQGILEDEGYASRTAATSEEAYEQINLKVPNLIILDIWLQNSQDDGIQILKKVRERYPHIPVIMISGHGTIETAVSTIKHGAYDFIEKPFKTDRLILMVRRALEAAELRRENAALKEITKKKMDMSLNGKSHAIQGVRQLVERVGSTNSRVLITGEPGTGKEMVARLLHKHSQRAEGPFLVMNCAMMHPERIEEELMGVEGGDDQISVVGMLERANGGTLLFDEISDMPLETQGKIVRIIQEQTFRRIGGGAPIKVDIRFLASTHRDLSEMIEKQTFRKDLYYRLNVVPLHMPRLKDRIQDLPELVSAFSAELAVESGIPPKEFSSSVIDIMKSYAWPGNIRQLKNAIEWMMIMSGPNCKVIDTEFLPPDLSFSHKGDVSKGQKISLPQQVMSADILSLSLREAREEFERQYLLSQINRFDGNVSKTAKFVGMERSALHRKLKMLQVVNGGHKEYTEEIEAPPQRKAV